MNLFKKRSVIFATLVILMIPTTLMTSCRKEGATVAQIKVIDTDGNPQENVAVRLYGEPTMDVPGLVVLDDTLYTNSEGYVINNYSDRFNLGQAGFAVLNIEAWVDPLMGEGIIKIEEEKTTTETVILQ